MPSSAHESLPHAVLDAARWKAVLDVVRTRLLRPVGLRSLAPGHPDYEKSSDGDLGTARSFLRGIIDHLDAACVGTISEVFDAEAPDTARGCCAQAWSVAEVLRCWIKTAPR